MREAGSPAYPRRVFRWLVAGVSVCALAGLAPAASSANHVSAAPAVTARGEPFSDRTWRVVVDWSINCSESGGSYFGDLKLVDADTDETTFLGGTAGPSGTSKPLVERRRVERRVYPVMRSSCGGGPPLYHGSGTREVRGDTVLIPALGDARYRRAPSGRDDGGQGRRDFPGGGFGSPRSPLRRGGCDTQAVGTQADDRLNGTSAADLIFGLAGDDRIGGRADDDCLIGGRGNDRLTGGRGWDRLTGGRGRDTLVGGSGKNRYDAGAGNDVVLAANKRAELVSCGSGRDRARIDRSDRVRGCERISRR